MGLTSNERMYVAAHRGDSYNYFENTSTAFKKAIESGADMIETDVHLTKDNELVLIHDDTVNRTSNDKGRVDEFTFEKIRELNVGNVHSYEQIPTLEELIKLVYETNVTLNIEIKEYYSEKNEHRAALCIEKVIELVEKYGMTQRVVINSFDAWVLEYVYKKYGKKYMLHGFYPYWEMSNVTIPPEDYLYCACIFDIGNKSHFDYLTERNIEPWIGASVTQEAKLRQCLEYGARLVTTNNPKDTKEKLNRIKGEN